MNPREMLRIGNNELGNNTITFLGIEYEVCPKCQGKYLDIHVEKLEVICWDALNGVRVRLDKGTEFALRCSNEGCERLLADFVKEPEK